MILKWKKSTTNIHPWASLSDNILNSEDFRVFFITKIWKTYRFFSEYSYMRRFIMISLPSNNSSDGNRELKTRFKQKRSCHCSYEKTLGLRSNGRYSPVQQALADQTSLTSNFRVSEGRRISYPRWACLGPILKERDRRTVMSNIARMHLFGDKS